MEQTQKKALVVDDEQTVRYVLCKDLQALGYECTTATNGEEALSKVDEEDFPLVVLDIRMPGMNGLEVLKRVRPTHPETCIIMVSALVDTDIASEALRLGADGYITKPWDHNELSQRLRQAQEHRASIKQSDEKHALSQHISQERKVDTAEVTRDLIAQQITHYERLMSQPGSQDKRHRRFSWWPWRRKH